MAERIWIGAGLLLALIFTLFVVVPSLPAIVEAWRSL
jgi:hypothetical protein